MNDELYTDNYGRIEPNIDNDYIMTTFSTETEINNNEDFNVKLNDLYNNNKYIIHELNFCNYNRQYHNNSYYSEKIFIDNYGNYYIYTLSYLGMNNYIILNRSNTNNIYRLPNKLIDFIKDSNEHEIINIEKNLINFHKVIEFTNNLITRR
jgi:hypothetical protein